MEMKIIKISKCEDCPYFQFCSFFPRYPENGRKKIPDWCPFAFDFSDKQNMK